jgi:hypothetical protein
LLLDRQSVAAFKPGEILEPSVRPAFSALGLHDRFFINNSLLLAGRLTAWDEPAATEMPGVLNPLGHGFLVDRAALENWLLHEVSRAGATVERGAMIAKPVRSAALWHIDWANDGCQNRAEAPLLIEATGRGPGVIGAGRRRGLDQLVALMAAEGKRSAPDRRGRRGRLVVWCAPAGTPRCAGIHDGQARSATDARWPPGSMARQPRLHGPCAAPRCRR